MAGLVCGLGLATSAAPAHGQRWQVDASATSVAADTAAAVGSASLAPAVEWRGRRLYGLVSGAVTGFEGPTWAAQARADLSAFAEPFGMLHPVRFEIVGGGQGTYHSSAFRTMTGRGEARLHVAGQRFGAWAGGAAATGWTSAERAFVSGFGGTAGVWTRTGNVQAAAVFTPLRLEDTWFPETSGRLAVAAGPLDIIGFAGWRKGDGDIATETWGGIAATAWLNGRIGLVASGGTYPNDLLQGLPGGRFVSLGIRVASRRPETPLLEPLGRPVYVEQEGRPTLRFRLRNAHSVALVGEWTLWEPIPLQRAPGEVDTWLLFVDLPAGVHRFNLVVDGERWIVPDGVMTVEDGFGGRVGLLIVP
jgi:hypothetical protein